MFTHQTSHGVATEIHKCPWLDQQQLLAPYFANAYSSPALSVVEADGMKPGKVIQAPEANIMAIMGISFTGIPQPDNELHQISLPSSRHRMVKLDNVNGQTFEWLYPAFR